MRALWLLPVVALAGCATAPPPLDIQSHCLPMVEYAPTDQTKFADETAALDKSRQYPVTLRFLGDYKAMRDANRTCKATAPK